MKTSFYSLLAIPAITLAVAQSKETPPLPPLPSAPTAEVVVGKAVAVEAAAPATASSSSAATPEISSEIERETRAALDHVREAIETGLGAARDAVPQIHKALQDVQRQLTMVASDARHKSDEDGETEIYVKDTDGMLAGGPTRVASPVVVRPSNPAADSSSLREDLAVMHKILSRAADKKGQRDSHAMVMGIEMISFGNNRKPQPIYLEGYGAVFPLSVGFPLKPAPRHKEENVEKTADTEWEKAKRELYGNSGEESNGTFFKHLGATFESAGWGSVRYDQERVEDLKNDLLESLRQSVNVRDLKAEESVVIIVTGSAASPSEKGSKTRRTVDAPEYGTQLRMARGATRPAPAQTTMTIHVRKSDAEKFASGKITLDEFQKKASIQIN